MKERFCGGTFLTAIFNEMHPKSTVTLTVLGRSATYSEPSCVESLLRVMKPSHRSYHRPSCNTQTSAYRNCKKNGGSDVPFHDPIYVESYIQRLEKDYSGVVFEMQEITTTYFLFNEPERAGRAVRTLLELIAHDTTISMDTPFRCLPDGSFLTKEALIHSETVCIPSFFVGLMEYFTKNVPNNTDGQETIQYWITRRGPQGKPILLASLGSDITQPIEIQTTVPVPKPTPIDQTGLMDIPADRIKKVREYLDDLYQRYHLYSDFAKQEFMELEARYVHIDLKKLWKITNESNAIYDPTFQSIMDYSMKTIIQGHGGSGKSMLMKHILLDAVTRFPATGVLPIFAELRKYERPLESLVDYLYSINMDLWGSSPKAFELHLTRNKTLILLDGYDEIKKSLRPQFRRILEDFVRKYKKVQVIISTRYAKSTLRIEGFLNLEILPLTSNQAVELIKKLDYRSPNPEIIDNFIDDLKDHLYETHGLIARTPLLLLFMLISYIANAQYVPTRMSSLFALMYRALAYDYDLKNKGGFIREFETGLTGDDLHRVISQFCALACWKHQYDFTSADFASYLAIIKKRPLTTEIGKIQTEAFMSDLIDHLCLLIDVGPSIYTFIHSAYQEYFCACHFASFSAPEKYKGFINLIENSDRMEDYTLKMLHEMVPEKIIPYIFIPLLEEIIQKCEEEDGCLTYLMTQYDEIFFSEGTVMGKIQTGCNSNILYYILTSNGFHNELDGDDVPESEYIRTRTEMYSVTDEDGTVYLAEGTDLVQKDSYYLYEGASPSKTPEAYEGNPKKIGGVYFIPTELLKDDRCEDLADFLTEESSPYYQEYLSLQSYLDDLKQLQETAENGFPEDIL